MKLHAVAPGGARRVSAKRSRKMVCRTTFVDPFRTVGGCVTRGEVHIRMPWAIIIGFRVLGVSYTSLQSDGRFTNARARDDLRRNIPKLHGATQTSFIRSDPIRSDPRCLRLQQEASVSPYTFVGHRPDRPILCLTDRGSAPTEVIRGVEHGLPVRPSQQLPSDTTSRQRHGLAAVRVSPDAQQEEEKVHKLRPLHHHRGSYHLSLGIRASWLFAPIAQGG